jgi:predicted secreted protein
MGASGREQFRFNAGKPAGGTIVERIYKRAQERATKKERILSFY